MKIRFKKLNPSAVLPSYAKEGDAGLDLTAITVNFTPKFIEYGTGLAVEIPQGYVGLIFPRSSVTNKDLMLKNSVGVIDSGYRGEIKFRFARFADPLAEGYYGEGERVGQLVILPYPHIEVEEATELSDTQRGEGGYGSTGN